MTPGKADEAGGSQQDEQHVRARLIFDVKSIKPGRPFRAGVELFMGPGWHTYYKESGDAGMPTRIQWALPGGFQAGELLWKSLTGLLSQG